MLSELKRAGRKESGEGIAADAHYNELNNCGEAHWSIWGAHTGLHQLRKSCYVLASFVTKGCMYETAPHNIRCLA